MYERRRQDNRIFGAYAGAGDGMRALPAKVLHDKAVPEIAMSFAPGRGARAPEFRFRSTLIRDNDGDAFPSLNSCRPVRTVRNRRIEQDRPRPCPGLLHDDERPVGPWTKKGDRTDHPVMETPPQIRTCLRVQGRIRRVFRLSVRRSLRGHRWVSWSLARSVQFLEVQCYNHRTRFLFAMTMGLDGIR